MSEKIIQSRIVQKHDTEANWIGKTTFVPKQGEVIVYDIDSNYNYERIKIGDGKTVVSSLPFIDDHALGQLETVKLQIQDLSIDGGTYRGNLNNAEANKVYWCALANCTNGPQSSGYGFLEVWTGLQRFTIYNTGDTYMRAYANDAWNDWQVVNEDKFAPAGDYVPTSRTVNGKALSSNISLSASDVGAAPIDHIHKSVSNPQMNYVDALATAEDQSICPLNTTTFLRWYHPTNGPLTNIDGYAIIRKLNVAPYIDLEFIQSGTGRRWLNTKGDNGWTGWVEKGTLEDVGAAPAGYTIYSGYFSSDSMLETRIANAYAGVADGKIGFAEMDSTSNAQTLMSGKWFFTIYRQNASTGFLIAEAPTASGTIKFQRTLSGGAWGSWVNISASAFAPAGFGLGTEAQGLNASHDLNTISQSGWYLWSAAAPANAPVIKWDAGYGYMRVDGRTANDFTQTVYSGYSDAKGIVVTRSVIGGTPGEWEWVNPPLTADETEYRTTERVNDKAVYKMMDAKGRLFWRLDGETAWKTGAPGCKAASVAVEYSLNTAGWYKIGTLYSGESHCSIATVSIGAWFNYSPSNAIVVDIAGSYLSVDATVRSRTGYAPDNQFNKMGLIMNNNQNYDIYLYYTNSSQNAGVVKIDTTIGSFIKEDSLTVASLTDSDFTKVVDLKTLSFALSSHSHSYLPLSGGAMNGQITLHSSGYKTYSNNGYSVDLYGNFKHLSTTTSDNWQIQSNSGTPTFQVYPESGNVVAAGTISEGGTLLSNKYVQTANLTNFRSKNLGQPGDYRWFVIPLVCLDNTEVGADRYFMGDIVLKRINGLSSLATTIHINCGKQYNSTLPYYTMSIEGRGGGDSLGYFTPCSFIYNEKLHFGICGQGMNATYDGTDNHASGYSRDWSIINIVPYYNNNTGSAENAEIYNSLSFYGANDAIMLANSFFGTPRVLAPNGTSAPTVYTIYHTGNKPTPADIGAVPTSRTINGKALTGNITLTAADVGTLDKNDIYQYSTQRVANTVLAAPNGSAGSATFRALVAADLPTIPVSKGGTGGTTPLSARTYLDAASVPIRLYNSAQPSATNLLIIKTSVAATSYGTMIHGTIRGNSYQSSQLFDVTFQVYNYESGSILAGHCYDAVSAFKNMTMLRGNDGFIYFAAELNTYQPYQTYDIHIGTQGGVHENLATSAYFGAKPAASKTYSLTMQYGLTTNNYSSYAVPTSRTINGKALTGNISLTAADVGALAVNGNAVSATYASILKPTDNTSTTTAKVSTWAANTSGGKIVWRNAFINSSISTDSGDMVLWLASDTAANGAKLNITIDGDYYANQSQLVLTSGNYSSYCAPASHTHSYLPISGGTLTGNVIAAATAIGTNAIRNIHGGTGALTAGSSALTTGSIYVQYV